MNRRRIEGEKMPRQNTFHKAQIMYEILKKKGQITIEDIIFQFEVSPSTAYNIAKLVYMLCERDETGSCERQDYP
ncbi:hypothetical protein [Sulfolobus sp. E11-6]|nr:hypothetical protein [Sulfolobus sp. E11-6]QGA67418.1 hypothetical protein GFS33_00020 [Sulfolobus sp. E11-6]